MNIPKKLLSHRKTEPEQKILYLVGTPIGNLNDISLRAINILKKVSLIACEDTRNTGKFLKHYNISNKLISFHEHNSINKLEIILSKLKSGDSIALVSDAGMPLISDPGEILVRKARSENIEIICIPGPCAALTALVSSGLETSKFSFYGFVPKSSKEREILLNTIFESRITSVVYESPKRIIKLLNDLKNICGGERECSLLKELTKRYEYHYGNNIDYILQNISELELRGEFTLVIAGNKNKNHNLLISNYELKKDLLNLIKAGLSHSAAASFLAKKSGKSKKEVYNLIID